jgi:hypothetical protein
MREQLDRHFRELFFSWMPYLYVELANVKEEQERAVIEAGAIQAIGFRYVGEPWPPSLHLNAPGLSERRGKRSTRRAAASAEPLLAHRLLRATERATPVGDQWRRDCRTRARFQSAESRRGALARVQTRDSISSPPPLTSRS